MQVTKVDFQSAFRCLSYPEDSVSTSVNNKILHSLACIFFIITEAQNFEPDEA